jgi:phosphatidylinositol dimannoside acyltransferase
MIYQCFLIPKGLMLLMRNQNGVSLQNIINGPMGILVLLTVTKILPPKAGYWLASTLGNKIAKGRNSSIVRAVRANQWVVSGDQPSSQELDKLTREVFINHGRCLYDFYKFVNKPDQVNQVVTLDGKFLESIKNSRSHRVPQILVMPHFSNYDLAARAAALNGLTMQVLSYPNPGRSYRWQNKFRNFEGIEVTPISISSLHSAVKRLEEGGTILTGIDRPNSGNDSRPNFFGKPASLPTGFFRIAIKTGVPIRVILCSTTYDGRYKLSVSDPVFMEMEGDSDSEVKIFAEATLRHIESLIKSNPGQWSMFYPVWPDVMNELPV